MYEWQGLPVYRFTLTLVLGGDEWDEDSVTYSVKGPDASPKILEYATSKLVSKAVEALQATGGRPAWSELYRTGDLAVSVRFVDVSGICWRRSPDGKLDRQ